MALLHRPIAEQVVTALQDVFGGGYQADKVIERLFKNNRKLGARDRRFIAETTYDLIRHWRFLWVALGESEPSLDHDPLMRLLGAYLIKKDDGELPPWPEFMKLDRTQVLVGMKRARNGPIAVRESVPDWLYEYGKKELGDRWDGILTKLNEPAPVCLRANRLKLTREELAKELLKGRRSGLCLRRHYAVARFNELFTQEKVVLRFRWTQQPRPIISVLLNQLVKWKIRDLICGLK